MTPKGGVMVGSGYSRGDLEHSVRALADSVAGLASWSVVPEPVRDRTLLVLFDTLGVMLAGAQTTEVQALARQWPSHDGPAPLVGMARRASMEASCWINGVSICCLELDEGNRFTRGHPAAHVVPAALAMGRGSTGADWLTAVLCGYEVAARYGKATRLHAGVHPHGTWGVTGAATAAGRLLSLAPDRLAAAMDAASALPTASHFQMAFRGNPVRNLWVGAANAAGIACARLAASAEARLSGGAEGSLGGILGRLDVTPLGVPLMDQFEILDGYFKRHASCAYTHSAADAVLSILEDGPIAVEEVESVQVETYEIAATLTATEWPSRLAAMFSIPYVVAVVAQEGSFGPSATDQAHRIDDGVRRLAEQVQVVASEEFERRLPQRRGARVTFRFADRSIRSAEIDQPIGDSGSRPFGWPEVREKIRALSNEDRAAQLEESIRALPEAETDELLDDLM